MKKLQQSLTNFFKSFNLFDILFLTISLTTLIAVFVICKSDYLSILYSLSAVFAMFCLSKAVFLYPIYQIISDSIYVIQAYHNGLYGESILNLCILIPLQIATAIAWFRNKRQTSQIQVNRLSWLEYVCIALFALSLIGPVYFLLRALNTNYLAISVATFILPMISYYLTFRRSVVQFGAYIVQNITIVLLWLMPIIYGGIADIGLLPMSLTFVMFVINNIYGFVNWRRKYKQQQIQLQTQQDKQTDIFNSRVE